MNIVSEKGFASITFSLFLAMVGGSASADDICGPYADYMGACNEAKKRSGMCGCVPNADGWAKKFEKVEKGAEYVAEGAEEALVGLGILSKPPDDPDIDWKTFKISPEYKTAKDPKRRRTHQTERGRPIKSNGPFGEDGRNALPAEYDSTGKIAREHDAIEKAYKHWRRDQGLPDLSPDALHDDMIKLMAPEGAK